MTSSMEKCKLKKNDEVKVIAGKDRGKSGRVLEVNKEKGRILVEGINMVKKAMKKKKQNDRGGIIEIEAFLHVSNVMIVCKKCGPTRIGYRLQESAKTRVCKKCGEAL
jgi:large subunit ribosomal protein L24